MVTKETLSGMKTILRQIELEDCTETYVNWLNDPEVNQYLETRWEKQNLEMIRSFVDNQRKNDHSILFAIISKKCDEHIGNIKIGPINKYHNHADISYFIGNKAYWNKGIITEAIGLVCKFGFLTIGLNKIEAGVYETAIGSWMALEKNGFQREGIFKEQVILGGKYIDIYRYGLLMSEWIEKIKENQKIKI